MSAWPLRTNNSGPFLRTDRHLEQPSRPFFRRWSRRNRAGSTLHQLDHRRMPAAIPTAVRDWGHDESAGQTLTVQVAPAASEPVALVDGHSERLVAASRLPCLHSPSVAQQCVSRRWRANQLGSLPATIVGQRPPAPCRRYPCRHLQLLQSGGNASHSGWSPQPWDGESESLCNARPTQREGRHWVEQDVR